MSTEKFTLRNEKEVRLINVKLLLAVEVEDYCCTFHLENKDNFTCTKSLKEVETILPDHFRRISRSTIVNMEKIDSLNLKQRRMKLTSGHSFVYSCRHSKQIRGWIFA